jgi:hypothetical protein
LPSDYGGDLPSVKELNEKQKDIFKEMRDYIYYEDKRMNGELDHLADKLREM